jgi:hypothetical protein
MLKEKSESLAKTKAGMATSFHNIVALSPNVGHLLKIH